MFKCKLKIDNKPYEVEIKAITGAMASVVVNDAEYQVQIEEDGQLNLSETVANPHVVIPPLGTPVASTGSLPPADGDHTIRVPMPGVVVRVKVEEGQQVRAGETVMILESMKMENNIVAPKDGIIQKILVKEGQDIPEHATIMEYRG